MLRISKLADYAVVVLTAMVRQAGEARMSAGLLSGRTGLPEPTVAKVLKLLAKEKIVFSARGAAGGYALAHAPESLSIASVIRAVDGPVALTSCVDAREHACDFAGRCAVRGRWDRVNVAVETALDEVKLSDMMPGFQQRHPREGGDLGDLRQPGPGFRRDDASGGI